MHGLPDVQNHHYGLVVVVRAIGNAALPHHVEHLGRWITHSHHDVRRAAVFALRTYPARSSARAFVEVLSPPAAFPDVFHDREVREPCMPE